MHNPVQIGSWVAERLKRVVTGQVWFDGWSWGVNPIFPDGTRYSGDYADQLRDVMKGYEGQNVRIVIEKWRPRRDEGYVRRMRVRV